MVTLIHLILGFIRLDYIRIIKLDLVVTLTMIADKGSWFRETDSIDQIE